MNPVEIVRGAIPGATAEMADSILWSRTCFPMGEVTARDLYRAASRCRRAHEHGLVMCEMCDRLAMNDTLCSDCDAALRRFAVPYPTDPSATIPACSPMSTASDAKE